MNSPGLAAEVDSILKHSACAASMTPEARQLLKAVKRRAGGKAAKGAPVVCEHCGRSGTPSAALRVIGLRLVQTSNDLSDTAIAASDAREPMLYQELEDLALLLGEIGTRLLGIEEPQADGSQPFAPRPGSETTA